MVTTPEDPIREPNEAEKLARRALELSREALAGDVQGGVRRIVLYILALVAILLLASDGSEHIERLFVGAVATVSLAILAMSDKLA